MAIQWEQWARKTFEELEKEEQEKYAKGLYQIKESFEKAGFKENQAFELLKVLVQVNNEKKGA